MDGSERSNGDDRKQDSLAEALRYADAGLRILPVNANKQPLTQHGFKDASSDPVVIEAWWLKWQFADPALAVPVGMVVVDLDTKNHKNGFVDFKDRAGCEPHDVMTPMATTPSGGLHIFFAATKSYKNAVAIGGTGIDIRAEGGYVVLPAMGNGRQWLRQLIGLDGAMTSLMAAPPWLDIALKKAPSTRMPLVLAPRAALAPPSSDPWAQKKAQAELEKACARIVAAPCGAQDSTRHAQCFYVGGLIARGDLGYEEAYASLLEAACAMPVYRDPWLNLEERVARSIEAGMERPLALSQTESWIRNFRARMRLQRPTTSAEARNG
jgi:Bifunctional DNA primase/polymerase, N-terminal